MIVPNTASGSKFPHDTRENPMDLISKLSNNKSALSGNKMLEAISGFLTKQTKTVLSMNKKFADYSSILENLTD